MWNQCRKYPLLFYSLSDSEVCQHNLCSILSTARSCPLLAKPPQHGRMNCSHPYSPFSYNSHCDFECHEGFWLRGTPTITCNSSGHWSQDLPTCQREHYLKCTSFVSLLLCSNSSNIFSVLSSGTVRHHPQFVFTPVYELLPPSGEFQLWLSVSFYL